jgi:hypothetical protein
VPWLEHSGTGPGLPQDDGELPQRDPISIKFDGTVRGVTLESGGALKCTGFLGRMIAYRNRVEVARADNQLIEPEDCGEDDVTFGIQGQLPAGTDLDSLVIQGVDPWTFEVFGECCGRARLNYTVHYVAAPALACRTVARGDLIATRGEEVDCRVTGSVSAVSGWLFAGKLDQDSVLVSSPSTEVTWKGPAVLSGVVSAIVSVGTDTITLLDTLRVKARSGAGWSWGDAKWKFREDAAKDGALKCSWTHFVQPSPTDIGLIINRRTSTCDNNLLAIIEPAPRQAPDSGFSADSVRTGPNAGLWYVTAVHYYMDRTSEMNPFIRPAGRADTLRKGPDLDACIHSGFNKKAPVVVNFYTYNTACRAFQLDTMFVKFWAHEGFGTKDPFDSNHANGHQARLQIGARDTLNDPYRIEGMVNTGYGSLRGSVVAGVLKAELRIFNLGDPNHQFVKDNYVLPSGSCGQAWVVDPAFGLYFKIDITQVANNVHVCF